MKWKPNCVAVEGDSIFVGNAVHHSVGGGLYHYNRNGHYFGDVPLKIGPIASVTSNPDLNVVYLFRNEVGKSVVLFADKGSMNRFIRSDLIDRIGEPQYAAYHFDECFTVITHSSGVIAVRSDEIVWSYVNWYHTHRRYHVLLFNVNDFD